MTTKNQISTGDRVHFNAHGEQHTGAVTTIFASVSDGRRYFYIQPENMPKADFIHGPYTANEIKRTQP